VIQRASSPIDCQTRLSLSKDLHNSYRAIKPLRTHTSWQANRKSKHFQNQYPKASPLTSLAQQRLAKPLQATSRLTNTPKPLHHRLALSRPAIASKPASDQASPATRQLLGATHHPKPRVQQWTNNHRERCANAYNSGFQCGRSESFLG